MRRRPPGYWRTLLWARSHRPPRGDVKDWPYWRALEQALLGLSRSYGVRYPQAAGYTLLEFGVAAGDSLEKLVRYRDILAHRLQVTHTLTAVGFDTFGGLPAARPEDVAAPWVEGDFARPREQVQARLARYRNVELVEGLFADTLPGWCERLEHEPPLFVSLDCDLYSSTVDVFEHVLPYAPTGCFFYFDDAATHYFSDRVGELQAVRELNEGRFGDHLELCEYPLWIDTGEVRHYRTLYRLLNLQRGGFTTQRPAVAAGRTTAR